MDSPARGWRAARLLIVLALASFAWAQERAEIRIGMVLDGKWERNIEIRTTFQEEIRTLLGREFAVRFEEEDRIVGDFTAASVRQAFDKLLADPQVDYVIALGPQASNHAAHRETLPKPVLAPFVIRAAVQGVPKTPEGTSGVPNLSYVEMGTDTVEEIRRFREITEFDHLATLVSEGLDEEVPRGNLQERLAEAGIDVEVTVIPVRHSAEEALASISDEIEAVYVTPLLQLAGGEFDHLIQGLIERKLPSFSLWGRSEVERGLLAGLGLDLDMQRLARRNALNLQQILLGKDPASLPVEFERRKRLTINMSTARAIQVYPSWVLLTEAEVVSDERPRVDRRVSLESAAAEAVQANLDLLSAERVVAAGRQRVQRARADLRPQVLASGSGTLIDKDRAEASFGSTGLFNLAGSIGVSQLIYSESVRANYDVERNLQRTREEERNELRLDIIRDGVIGYLNVLRAKTVERIVQSNLELTRRNLERAQTRQRLGAASPDEVYRFQSEIAVNRRDVIDANAVRNQSEIELNRVLNRPLEESFETEDASLDDPRILLSFSRLRPYLSSLDGFKIFRSFMVQEAFDGSPELRRLEAAIDVQRRVLLASRRSFYVPDVSAQAMVTQYGRYGSGAGTPIELPDGLEIPTAGTLDWNIGFTASLPLFTSGARGAEVQRATEELEQLRIDFRSVRQRVEQRTRSNLHAAGASFAGIRLAQDAAEAARKTLELVADAYSRGAVDNIRLLDAQNQTLQAELGAANAIYDFLVDLMEVERAAGRFDFFVGPEEERAFLERMNEFYRQQGFPVPSLEETP